MTVKTEGVHAGQFIVSEANNTRSREQVTILSGQSLAAGAVLGKITGSGKYVQHDPAGTTGEEAAAGVLIYPIDASDGDVEAAAILRDAEVQQSALDFDGISTSNENLAIADLLALGIIMR